MRWLMILLVLLFVSRTGAQTVLTEETFLAAVKTWHPLARTAALEVDIAKASLLSARGGFDPLLSMNTARKDFDGIRYYRHRAAELKIPTWYGIDIYAGAESLAGERTNPEETRGTISYLGVSVPLVQNLVMDKRRAVLQKAKVQVAASGAYRRNAVNDLLHEALHQYWQWWEYYHIYRLVDSSLAVADRRLAMVKTAYRLGDRPAIDTLEALTQVQAFRLQQAEAYTQLLKAQLELSVYLWKENAEPWDLPPAVVPQGESRVEAPLLQTFLEQAVQHPQLQQYHYKLASQRIEKKLAFQSLLPEVDLKYNQLGKGIDMIKTAGGAWFQNNYRFGISLSAPLRLSEGRGAYKRAALEMEQTALELANKRVVIQNKTKQYWAEWEQSARQLEIQGEMIQSYTALQRGEETRFRNGESSLFLVNAREQKTLEAKQKWIAIKGKNARAQVSLHWAAGLLQ